MRVADLGLRFVITTLLGAAAGLWADRRLDVAPTLTIVGFFLGFGLATVGLVRGVTPAKRAETRDAGDASGEDGDP